MRFPYAKHIELCPETFTKIHGLLPFFLYQNWYFKYIEKYVYLFSLNNITHNECLMELLVF